MNRNLLILGGTLLSSMVFWAYKLCARDMKREEKTLDVPKDVEKQANDYYPVQSPSERAAGHPIVGMA